MTNRTIQHNGGYSKKELIEIIEDIDANKNKSKTPAGGTIHSNNHLISTSLKDLSEKYQNLSSKQVDYDDWNKKI